MKKEFTMKIEMVQERVKDFYESYGVNLSPNDKTDQVDIFSSNITEIQTKLDEYDQVTEVPANKLSAPRKVN